MNASNASECAFSRQSGWTAAAFTRRLFTCLKINHILICSFFTRSSLTTTITQSLALSASWTVLKVYRQWLYFFVGKVKNSKMCFLSVHDTLLQCIAGEGDADCVENVFNQFDEWRACQCSQSCDQQAISINKLIILQPFDPK